MTSDPAAEVRKRAGLYAGSATGYFLAARMLYQAYPNRNPDIFPAILTNLSVCLELSLNAYVMVMGGEQRVTELRRNLTRTFDKAVELGYSPEPGLGHLVSIVSSGHQSHPVRYLADESILLPDLQSAFLVIHAHLRDVSRLIN